MFHAFVNYTFCRISNNLCKKIKNQYFAEILSPKMFTPPIIDIMVCNSPK